MDFKQQPKPAPTFGALQQNFVYRLRNFSVNDQFTIIEDIPATKPLRQAFRTSAKGTPYQVFLIKVSSGGFEADLELFDAELNGLAIACPKNIPNIQGVTLAFDGRKWVYVCQDTTPKQPVQASQPAPCIPTPAIDPMKAKIDKVLEDMKYLNKVGIDVKIQQLTNICSAQDPGRALELIKMLKDQGYIYEQDGTYKAI